MRHFICCFSLICGIISVAKAQIGPATATTVVADKNSKQALVSSGKLRRNFYFSVAPGASYALRFTPSDGQQSLTSLHLHFKPFGRDTAKVPVRVRIANVTATGSPADNDLLPTPVLLANPTLQELRQPLVLMWATGQVHVPANGFFVVIEGVGSTPDEYVAGLSRPWAYSYNGYYQLAHRQQPDAPLRLLNRLSIPMLLSAKPTTLPTSLWTRGGDQPDWQPDLNYKQVPLLEIGFE